MRYMCFSIVGGECANIHHSFLYSSHWALTHVCKSVLALAAEQSCTGLHCCYCRNNIVVYFHMLSFPFAIDKELWENVT